MQIWAAVRLNGAKIDPLFAAAAFDRILPFITQITAYG